MTDENKKDDQTVSDGASLSAPICSGWVFVDDRLPDDGKYVFIHLTQDNWHDPNDPDGVYFKSAKLVRGISQEERDRMIRGEIPDLEVRFGDGGKSVRSRVYREGDEWSNNCRPFCWQEFGSGGYWGQEVDFWMPIPSLPNVKLSREGDNQQSKAP